MKVSLQLLLQLFDALGANPLARKINDIVRPIAEGAGRLIFLQNDTVLVNKNFNGVLFLDAQRLTDLNGQHDPSQIIHLANYSRGFHPSVSFALENSLGVDFRLYYNKPVDQCQAQNLEIKGKKQ